MFLSKEMALEILYKMHCARSFEYKLAELFQAGELYGTTHLSVGQEGTAAGAIYALNKDDLVLSTHRGHAISIMKGTSPNAMMAEMFGKKAGCCKGLGGSLHIVDTACGNYGANGIMAASLPIATGVALSLKKANSGKVVAAFFGDASANNGAFHEALNIASLWKLPVIFICENNQYGMSTHIDRHNATSSIAGHAVAYGIPGILADGNDVPSVLNATAQAAHLARSGGGPSLLELETYRWLGHSKSDKRVYRTREEEAVWHEKCPIQRFSKHISQLGVTADKLVTLQHRAEKKIEASVEFARSCQPLRFAEAQALVYATKEEHNA